MMQSREQFRIACGSVGCHSKTLWRSSMALAEKLARQAGWGIGAYILGKYDDFCPECVEKHRRRGQRYVTIDCITPSTVKVTVWRGEVHFPDADSEFRLPGKRTLNADYEYEVSVYDPCHEEPVRKFKARVLGNGNLREVRDV